MIIKNGTKVLKQARAAGLKTVQDLDEFIKSHNIENEDDLIRALEMRIENRRWAQIQKEADEVFAEIKSASDGYVYSRADMQKVRAERDRAMEENIVLMGALKNAVAMIFNPGHVDEAVRKLISDEWKKMGVKK